MMLAGLPVPDDAIDGLAALVRTTGADDLADRLERAVADGVKLIALTLDERALLLAALEDPPLELAELRASCSTITSGGALALALPRCCLRLLDRERDVGGDEAAVDQHVAWATDHQNGMSKEVSSSAASAAAGSSSTGAATVSQSIGCSCPFGRSTSSRYRSGAFMPGAAVPLPW